MLNLPLQHGPAARLLDEGAAMLDALPAGAAPTLRWYRSTDAAVVVGRGQRVAAFDGTDLPVLGRFSGGGAVLMDDGLLSLDVLVPAGHDLLDGDLSQPFLRIGNAWASALRELGVPDVAVHEGPVTPTRRGTPREQLLAAICYATLGRGEVTSGGRKMVGLAQRRRRPGALIQCGLLRRWDPGPLLTALAAGADDEAISSAAVGLDELMVPAPSDDQIMRAVQAALERVVARP